MNYSDNLLIFNLIEFNWKNWTEKTILIIQSTTGRAMDPSLSKMDILFEANMASIFCTSPYHDTKQKQTNARYKADAAARKFARGFQLKQLDRRRRKIEASAGLRKAQLLPAMVARRLNPWKKGGWNFLPVLPAWCAPGHRWSLGSHPLPYRAPRFIAWNYFYPRQGRGISATSAVSYFFLFFFFFRAAHSTLHGCNSSTKKDFRPFYSFPSR